ncbi:hypothetical protein [Nonomuraea typhae]|uniref:Uncharacterized protein n=1 Tax=Nonomuraea typhae TaxID=2603600 RepID=A0ABW7YL13_9ACTN
MMTIEPHGARLTAPVLLAPLSVDAQVWSFSWDVNQHAWVTHARGGRCLAHHEFFGLPRARDIEPSVFTPYQEFLAGHLAETADDASDYEGTLIRWWAAGMTIVELAGGVRLRAAALAGPLPTLLYA